MLLSCGILASGPAFSPLPIAKATETSVRLHYSLGNPYICLHKPESTVPYYLPHGHPWKMKYLVNSSHLLAAHPSGAVFVGGCKHVRSEH